MRASPRATVLALIASTLVGGACGGGGAKEPTTPPVVVSAPEPEPPDEDDADGVVIEGTMGTVDKVRVQNAIEARAREIDVCYTSSLRGTRYVGGTVELEVKIDATGAVTSARMAAGDLGSWPVERCLIALVRGLNLGEPSGGPVAVTRIPLERQGRGALEDAVPELTTANLDPALWESVATCEGTHAGVEAVLYVAPSGLVTSAGFVATTEPIDEAWADCAHDAIRAWRLPAPRGKVVRHRSLVP